MEQQPINITFTAHLTEQYQWEQANKLISKLRMELAAANEYIAELESVGIAKEKADELERLKAENESLTKQNDQLKEENKAIMNKYSQSIQKIVDSRLEALKVENKNIRAKNAELVKTRDSLIAKLYVERGI